MMHAPKYKWRDPIMKTENVSNAHNLYKQYIPPALPGKEDDTKPNDFLTPIDRYTPTIVEGTANPEAIKSLWSEFNHVAEAVRKLVAASIGKNDASGQGFWAVRAKSGFKLSEIDQAQAQELISEDGFFGVKKTTQRIIDFAKALVGENASEDRIELMRAAVQKGFDEVARLFGGFDKLPDVTKQTYDAIMKAFDEWIAGGASEEDAESA